MYHLEFKRLTDENRLQNELISVNRERMICEHEDNIKTNWPPVALRKSSCNSRTSRGHSSVPRRPGCLECWNEFIFLEKDIQI